MFLDNASNEKGLYTLVVFGILSGAQNRGKQLGTCLDNTYSEEGSYKPVVVGITSGANIFETALEILFGQHVKRNMTI